uniref:Transposase n=1 Tax=Heterorhabditis bacteriophora TaxID=37862 RepID=A0A1I7WK21_HETBA
MGYTTMNGEVDQLFLKNLLTTLLNI